MMISHAIQARDPQSGFLDIRPTTSNRSPQARGLRVVSISQRERTQAARREALEPVLSIEEAIRRYLETQPVQLYRGGA